MNEVLISLTMWGWCKYTLPEIEFKVNFNCILIHDHVILNLPVPHSQGKRDSRFDVLLT